MMTRQQIDVALAEKGMKGPAVVEWWLAKSYRRVRDLYTGPFASRADAKTYLRRRPYKYPPLQVVRVTIERIIAHPEIE